MASPYFADATHGHAWPSLQPCPCTWPIPQAIALGSGVASLCLTCATCVHAWLSLQPRICTGLTPYAVALDSGLARPNLTLLMQQMCMARCLGLGLASPRLTWPAPHVYVWLSLQPRLRTGLKPHAIALGLGLAWPHLDWLTQHMCMLGSHYSLASARCWCLRLSFSAQAWLGLALLYSCDSACGARRLSSTHG